MEGGREIEGREKKGMGGKDLLQMVLVYTFLMLEMLHKALPKVLNSCSCASPVRTPGERRSLTADRGVGMERRVRPSVRSFDDKLYQFADARRRWTCGASTRLTATLSSTQSRTGARFRKPPTSLPESVTAPPSVRASRSTNR